MESSSSWAVAIWALGFGRGVLGSSQSRTDTWVSFPNWSHGPGTLTLVSGAMSVPEGLSPCLGCWPEVKRGGPGLSCEVFPSELQTPGGDPGVQLQVILFVCHAGLARICGAKGILCPSWLVSRVLQFDPKSTALVVLLYFMFSHLRPDVT